MHCKLYAVLFLLFVCLHTNAQQIIKGKVIRIADGDTMTILGSDNVNTKVRLHGIDCPESNQDFGQVAKRFVAELCFGQTVSVEVKDIDRYKRTVGTVYAADGTNINLALLQAGLAWHYTSFDKSVSYAEAERDARKEGRGLWKQSNSIAPWEFRAMRRNKAKTSKAATKIR